VPLAIMVPELVGTIDPEQLDVVALTVVKVHGLPVNEPPAVPVLLSVTVPAGEEAVPAVAVSLTNAVQLTAWPTTTVAGEHDTRVEVVLLFTVTVLLVPLLPLWTVSLGLYVALAITLPEEVGLNDTGQLGVVALIVVRLHGVPVNDPDAVPVFVNATVPAGVDGVPVAISLTKAVQLMD